jgi:thiamine pyrophosphokinase
VDHTLNNFSILPKFANTMRLSLRDAASVAYLVPDTITLETSPGDRISLIPLPSAIISTSGLAWPLRNELLAIGIREGISNEATGPKADVRVSEGMVLVFHYARFTIYD